jgi:hypothetical protein
MAACHSAASCSAFGSFVMYVPGVFEGDQLATIGQRDRIIERTLPSLLVGIDLEATRHPRRRVRTAVAYDDDDVSDRKAATA